MIDLRVLRRLGIAYGSTTDDLGFRHSEVQYVTKHYALVLGWLPPQCICGRLSTKGFKALLEQSQIDVSSPSGLLPLLYM